MSGLGPGRRWALSLCVVLFATAPADARAALPAIEPAVCADCAPPLDYSGGPVTTTNTAKALMVTPVYWAPTGGQYAFPPRYASAIDRFIANVAAASGTTNNVFSIATEYYGRNRFGINQPVVYSMRAGPVVDDTGSFPRSACQPAIDYTACLTDVQLRVELSRVVRSRKLPVGLEYAYALFLPPRVEVANSDGTNSAFDFCAYHLAFHSGGQEIVYAIDPYEPTGNCTSGQAPSGNLVTDGAIGIFSHEIVEIMTDPLTASRAWNDTTGHEIADMCAFTYGRPLGSTNTSKPSETEYNQVINGGRYYLPQEFSNLAFKRFGPDRGCVTSENVARSSVAAATGFLSVSPQTFIIDATPTAVPADGKSTATIVVSSSDAAGDGLRGDRIHFGIGVEAGSGDCGALSSSDQTTDAEGRVSVVYTASSDDVVCWILASDSERGRSAEAVIYQGDTQHQSPAISASFPTALQSGGAPATFTLKLVNTSSDELLGLLPHFVVFPASRQTGSVKADQVHLAYSTKGRNGPFTAVPLVGSTSKGNIIQGYIGPLWGTTLKSKASETVTLRVGLDRGVPVSKTAPLLIFQTFLDQTDAADGSDSTLADTDGQLVTVPARAAAPHTFRDVGIGLVILLVGAVTVGLVLWSRTGRGAAR
jgi:hypothetical protein